MSETNHKLLSRRSPQPAYTEIPEHYENDDIPHVLARVRFMREFLGAIDDGEQLTVLKRVALRNLYMDLLGDALAPYALDLALSLIALEDSVDPEEMKPVAAKLAPEPEP